MLKKFVVFSVLVIALFVLSACGGAPAPAASDAPAASESSTVPDGAAPVALQEAAPVAPKTSVVQEAAPAQSKKVSPVTLSESTPEEVALAVETSAGYASVVSVAPDMSMSVMSKGGDMLSIAAAGTHEHLMGVTSAPDNSEAYVVTATPEGNVYKYVVTSGDVKKSPLSSLSIPAMSMGSLSTDGGWLAYVDASAAPYVGLVYAYANGESRIELPAQLHDVIVGNLVWLKADTFAVMVYDVAASAASSVVPQAASDQEPPHKWWTVTINGKG